jgi:curved DNA-binding protein CbpA
MLITNPFDTIYRTNGKIIHRTLFSFFIILPQKSCTNRSKKNNLPAQVNISLFVSEKEMGNKDYYAILGISRWATDDEIKRAYKQKALQYHPDKNRDDIDAEKKFTDISEAYEMLSDPNKRSLYDRFGSDNSRNYFNTNSRPNNFRHSFSTGHYHTNSTHDSCNNYFIRIKDPTTFYDLYVTLDEVNNGTIRKLKVTRKRFKLELNTAVKDEKVLEIQINPGWKEGSINKLFF